MTINEAIAILKQQFPDGQGPGAARRHIQNKIDACIELTDAERTFMLWSLGLPMEDVHKHRCPNCKFVWQHDGAKLQALPEDGYAKAHLCPKGCGIDVRDRYFEEEDDRDMPLDADEPLPVGPPMFR